MIEADSKTLEEMGVSSGEVHFPSESILASVTDQRGVISFANPAFSEISGLRLDQLVGAPHKIVRHPDMPRGLFHLMWSRLKAGKPVCTYVKNKTANGGFYWVLALVTHLPEGYISVRIKPGGALFGAAQDLYGKLIKHEAEGLTPDKSEMRLLDAVKAAGHDDFDAFMCAVLDEEMALRDEAIGSKTPHEIILMNELKALIGEIETLIGEIGVGFRQIRGEPVNMRILSGRLDGAGAAIGTISQNYDAMADEMQQVIERMQSGESGSLTRMKMATMRGRFAAQVARLLNETAEQAKTTEIEDDSTQEYTDIVLPGHANNLTKEAQIAIREIAATGKEITDFCRQLRRRINGLDVVKLLCRVESGRIGHSDSGLEGIIARLEQFHERTDVFLADLAAKASQITTKSAAL